MSKIEQAEDLETAPRVTQEVEEMQRFRGVVLNFEQDQTKRRLDALTEDRRVQHFHAALTILARETELQIETARDSVRNLFGLGLERWADFAESVIEADDYKTKTIDELRDQIKELNGRIEGHEKELSLLRERNTLLERIAMLEEKVAAMAAAPEPGSGETAPQTPPPPPASENETQTAPSSPPAP